MKIVILYHPQSDHGRIVDEYVRDFTRLNPEVSLKSISVDTREGWSMAELYDITAYPAMLSIREGGELAKCWMDLPLPLMNEVAFYAFT